jgi:hypothetical protein
MFCMVRYNMVPYNHVSGFYIVLLHQYYGISTDYPCYPYWFSGYTFYTIYNIVWACHQVLFQQGNRVRRSQIAHWILCCHHWCTRYKCLLNIKLNSDTNDLTSGHLKSYVFYERQLRHTFPKKDKMEEKKELQQFYKKGSKQRHLGSIY